VGFVAARLRRRRGRRRVSLRPPRGAAVPAEEPEVKTLLALLAWCLLFVLCWPLALLALVLWPLVWLLALPLRLLGITLGAVFAFLQSLLYLPARALGWRPARAQCAP